MPAPRETGQAPWASRQDPGGYLIHRSFWNLLPPRDQAKESSQRPEQLTGR